MPALPFGNPHWSLRSYRRQRVRPQQFSQEIRLIMASAPLIITPHYSSNIASIEAQLVCQKVEQELHQTNKGDAVGPARPPIEPFTPTHESMERRGLATPD